MKSKKGLLIVVIMFLIILAIGGTVLGLFLKTDIFKTEQQKFWKYLGYNEKTVELMTFPDVLNYIKTQTDNSFQSKAELKFNIQDGSNDVKSVLQKMVLKSTKSFDKEKDSTEMDMKLMIEEHELFNLIYIRDKEKYALKSEEIANVAIGIENNNLKEFARNMGVEDVSEIPDKIESNFDDVFNYPKEKYNMIINGYLKNIYNIVPKEKYIELKDVKAKVNGEETTANLLYVVFSENEIKEIILKSLKYAKEDQNTQEYFKEVIKNEMPDGTKIDDKFINDKIDESIKELEEIETTEDEFLRINLYVKKQNLIKTEIVLEGTETVTLEYKKEENKENLVISTLFDEETNSSIINKETIGDKIITKIENESEDYDIDIEFSTRGSVEQNDMKFEGKVTLTDKEENIIYNLLYENKPDFRKTIANEGLNNKNSSMLNSYSYEEIKKLSNNLQKRILEVYTEKENYIKTTYEEGFTGIPSIDDGMVNEGRVTESGELTENFIIENVVVDNTINY